MDHHAYGFGSVGGRRGGGPGLGPPAGRRGRRPGPGSAYLPSPFGTPPLSRQTWGLGLSGGSGSLRAPPPAASTCSGSSSWLLWREAAPGAKPRARRRGRLCSALLAGSRAARRAGRARRRLARRLHGSVSCRRPLLELACSSRALSISHAVPDPRRLGEAMAKPLKRFPPPGPTPRDHAAANAAASSVIASSTPAMDNALPAPLRIDAGREARAGLLLLLDGRLRALGDERFEAALADNATAAFRRTAARYAAMVREAVAASPALGPALLRVDVHRFAAGSLLVFFRLTLDRRKV
ncbi:Uncharacterized protein GBIM_03384, partial [Gryllus bimaculatus]